MGERNWIRIVLIVVSMLVLAWFSAAQAVGDIAAARAPRLAARFSPSHAAALAELAALEAGIGNRALAVRLAEESIRQTAVPTPAISVLASLEATEGNRRVASNLFNYVSSLSRREAGAQMWLSQDAMLVGDSDAALKHLNAALRVSKSNQTQLFQLLTLLLSVDTLVDPISQVFRSDPPWLAGFIAHATQHPRSLPNLARIMIQLPDDSSAKRPGTQEQISDAMVEAGLYPDAHRFLKTLVPGYGSAAVWDPGFTSQNSYGPLQWEYEQHTARGAYQERGGGLRYEADSGKGGLVARQILSLTPGAYILTTIGTSPSPSSDGEAIWLLRCAGTGALELVRLAVPDGKEKSGSDVAFSVPPESCSNQSLELHLLASFSPGGLEGTVHKVDIHSIAKN
ncbi:hypothetical protein [Sphingosinicella humi]|uniref:hypothetical protein n=1 Tax=Allosphingosinicella humi TaxID=2068657 RepID=UPI0011B29089|nr:hypothetical protein [Sphingosinicella humi]